MAARSKPDNVVEIRPGTNVPGDVFDEFVRAQHRALVGYLMRRNSIEDAEEIAQESIVRLLRYRDDGYGPEDWQPLLYRIAINCAQKRGRLNALHPHVRGGEPEYIADQAPLPEEQVADWQRARRLQSAILELPPKRQRVFLLRQSYGLSYAQIAERCGISVKMVEKHLAKALRQLQDAVGGL